MLHSALARQAHNEDSEAQKTLRRPAWAIASAWLPTEVPWPDAEMAEGFGGVAARRNTILVAWGEPSVSWPKQIKIEKNWEINASKVLRCFRGANKV
jgi:hypothetical protein